jgi:hypothetical protein
MIASQNCLSDSSQGLHAAQLVVRYAALVESMCSIGVDKDGLLPITKIIACPNTESVALALYHHLTGVAKVY